MVQYARKSGAVFVLSFFFIFNTCFSLLDEVRKVGVPRVCHHPLVEPGCKLPLDQVLVVTDLSFEKKLKNDQTYFSYFVSRLSLPDELSERLLVLLCDLLLD